MPSWPAEMVPLLVMPPPALPLPKTVTVLTSMPPWPAMILPLLTILPKTVVTLNRSMPAPAPEEMVPVFVIPPPALLLPNTASLLR